VRFPVVRDFRKTTLELNQLAEDVRRRAASEHTHPVSEIAGLAPALADKVSVAALDAALIEQESLQWFLQL
jgi:hypothetical protein